MTTAPVRWITPLILVAGLSMIAFVIWPSPPRGTQAPTDALWGTAPQLSVLQPLGRDANGILTWRDHVDGAVMVWVPAGAFAMGSRDGEGDADEHPRHTVGLDGYFIDQCEVTIGQWRTFATATGYRTDAERDGFGIPEGSEPAYAQHEKSAGASWRQPSWDGWTLEMKALAGRWTDAHPVLWVSWNDADAYARWAGKELPSEAQWEHAARGATGRRYAWGDELPPSRKTANIADLAFGGLFGVPFLTEYDDGYAMTSPVGSFPEGASPFGCLDMTGNVWEWCRDFYASDFYGEPGASARNAENTIHALEHVYRGGAWVSDPPWLRAAGRYKGRAGDRSNNLGFRCVRTPR